MTQKANKQKIRIKKNPTRKGEEAIPLEIIGNLVFKTSGRVNLPLDQFLLKPIASNLTQSLEKESNQIRKEELGEQNQMRVN